MSMSIFNVRIKYTYKCIITRHFQHLLISLYDLIPFQETLKQNVSGLPYCTTVSILNYFHSNTSFHPAHHRELQETKLM